MDVLSTSHSIGGICKTSPIEMDIIPLAADLHFHFPSLTCKVAQQCTRLYSAQDTCDWCRWPPGSSAGKLRGLNEVSLGEKLHHHNLLQQKTQRHHAASSLGSLREVSCFSPCCRRNLNDVFYTDCIFLIIWNASHWLHATAVLGPSCTGLASNRSFL